MPMPYIIRPKGYSFSRDTDSFQSESWRNPFSSQPVPEREFQKLSDSAPRLNADSMRAVFSGKDPYAFVPKEDRRVVDELARRKASDTGRPLEEIQKEFGVYAQLSNVGPLRGLSFSQCGELAEETCRRLLEQDGEDVSDPVPGYNGGMANRKANYTLKYFEHLKSLYAAEEPSGIQRVGNAVAAGAQKLATAVYKPVAGAVALGTKAASAIGAISDDMAKGILDGMAREVSGNDQWIAEGREGYVSDPEWYKHWDGFAKNLALTVISEAPTQAYRTALAIFTGPMGSALEAGAEATSGKFADLHAEGKDAEMGAGKTAINLLSTGMINGGLQWMAGEWAVGRMFGPGKAAVRSSFKEAAKHVVKGFPVEAGQEGAEQLLENFTDICTGVHGDPALLTSEERLAILMQGVPESALVGGALGGVTGSITAGRVYKAQKLVNEAIPYAQNVKEALVRAGSLSEDERAVLDHANRILDGVKTCDMGVELARLEERKRNIVAQFAWEMKRADDYAFSDPEGSYGQDADPVEVGTRQWLDSLAKRSDLTDRGVRARMDMEARMACAELLAKIPHDPEETGKAAFAFAKKAGVPEGFRVDVAQGEVTWATIPAEVRAFVTENGGGQTVPRWAPIDNGVWINANLVTPSQVPNVMLSRSLMERGLHEVLGNQYEDTMLKAYSALKDDPEMRRIADGMREDSAMPGAGMTDADMIDAATRWMIDAASDGRKAPGAFRKALQAFRQAIGRSPFGGATLSDQDVLTLAGRALDKARSGDGEASVREFVDGFDERELSEIDRMAQAAGVKWRRATAEEYSAAVEEAAGRQGISAEQFQKERGVNGWFQEEDGTVVLSPGADHLSAFLHEMLHWLASSRPEQYRTIAAAVMEEAGREAPEGSFATDEMQEAVADEFSRQMRDNAAAKRMLSRLDSDRNAAFAIRDFLSEAAHRLSGDAFADVRGNLERLVRWLGNASTRAGGAQGVRFSTKNPDYANRSEGQNRLRRLESFYSREQIDAIAAMLKPIVEEIAAPEFFEGNDTFWKFQRENGKAKGINDRVANLVLRALAQQGVKVESKSLAIDLARQAYFARQEDLRQVAIRRISAWLESDSSEEPSWLADEMERALRPVFFSGRIAERRKQKISDFVAATWGDGAMPVLKDAVQTAEGALQGAEHRARPTRSDQRLLYKQAIWAVYGTGKFADVLSSNNDWKFIPSSAYRGHSFSGDFIDNTWCRFSSKTMSKNLPDKLKARIKEKLDRTQLNSYGGSKLEDYLDIQEENEFFEEFNNQTLESKGQEALEYLRQAGRLYEVGLEDSITGQADEDDLDALFKYHPVFKKEGHGLTEADVMEAFNDLRENGLNLLFVQMAYTSETRDIFGDVFKSFTWEKLNDTVRSAFGSDDYADQAQPLLYWTLQACIRSRFSNTPWALEFIKKATDVMLNEMQEKGVDVFDDIYQMWTEDDWAAFDFVLLDQMVNQQIDQLPREIAEEELDRAIKKNRKLEDEVSELQYGYNDLGKKLVELRNFKERREIEWQGANFDLKKELDALRKEYDAFKKEAGEASQAKLDELKKELDALRKEYDAFKKEAGEASQAKLDELQKELDKKTRAYERLKEADAKRTQNNHNDLMELRRLLRDQKRDHMTEQEIRKVGSLAAKVTRNMPEHQAKQFVQNAMRLAMTPNTQDAAHPHGARTEGFDLLMEKAREELQRQAAQQAVEQMRALANRNRTASTRKGILTSRITPEAQAKIDFAADCLELGARASRAAIDRGVELMQRLESEENPEESVQFMGRKVGREELSWMLHALETYGETPEEHAAEGWQELNSLVENGRAEFDAARAERTARVSAAANEVKERIQGTRDVDRSAANREDKPTGFFNKIGVSTLKNDLLRLNRDEELETDFGKGGWLNKAWRSINEAEYDLSARNLKLREDTHEFLKRLAGGTRTGYARFVADAGKEQDTGVEIPVYSSRIGGKEDPNAYYVKGRRPSAKILVDVDAARAALVEFEAKGAAEVRTDEGTVQMDEFNAAFLRRQLADHDAKLELDLELSPDAAENELLNRELNEDREKGKLTMRIPLREEETENIHLECSKLQALQILLSWDQSDVRTIMEWNGWKESHMERLRAFCGEKVLEFGQWMRSRLAESRQELDAEVVKRFGAHMPTVENYFPTRYRRQAQAGLTPARQAGQAKTPDTGFLVSRRFHTLNLDTTRDAFTVFMDTMQGQNRFIAMANRMADIKNVLMRPDVKEAIRTRHGSEFLAGLTKKLAAVDGGGLVVETNGILSRLCSPFVLDALGFNPSSFMKQMLSGFGFLNWGGVTTGGFVRAFGDVLSMSPEYRRFLKEAKASDYYQNRVKTGGHAAQRFVSGDSKQAILAHGFADAVSKASMKPIQWGDSASALGPGGFAVYQDTRLRVLDECIEQELSAAREEAQSEGRTLSRAEELSARERGEEAARKEALMQWQMATDQTQQSSYAKDKSLGVQSAYGRFFGLFMQNPMQILDLYAQNLRTMKRTGDKGQAARNLIVNHVLLPTLMLAVTDFFRYGFDPDKWEKVNLKAKFAEYLAAWIVGPFAGAIILGDVYSGTISSLTAKLFGTSAKGNPSGTFVQRVADEWTRLWSLISGDAPFEDKAAGLASAGALAASLVPIFSSNPAVTSISEAAAKVLSTGSSAQRQSKRLRKMVGMDGEDEQKDRARKIMQSR